MSRRAQERLYEGKAKVVFATDDPDRYMVHFKDDATAFNGQKKALIARKGEYNLAIAAQLFRHLERHGVPTHFVDVLGERDMLVKKLRMIPVEVVVRNVAAGSLAQRLGLPEGERLPHAVLELYLKNDALGDPMINRDHIRVLGLADDRQMAAVEERAHRVNHLLQARLEAAGLLLVDFKLEFGLDGDGQVVLGDEISPDSCRLWDISTNDKMDKDRFRRDLGGVADAYAEVLRRLQASAGKQETGPAGPGTRGGGARTAGEEAGSLTRWQAEVRIQLKNSILDPAGEAVRRSLTQLGYAGTEKVQVGKLIRLEFQAEDRAAAERQLADMCSGLLVNPVLEQAETSLREAGQLSGDGPAGRRP